MLIVGNRIRIQGFIVSDFAEDADRFYADLKKWIDAAKSSGRKPSCTGSNRHRRPSSTCSPEPTTARCWSNCTTDRPSACRRGPIPWHHSRFPRWPACRCPATTLPLPRAGWKGTPRSRRNRARSPWMRRSWRGTASPSSQSRLANNCCPGRCRSARPRSGSNPASMYATTACWKRWQAGRCKWTCRQPRTSKAKSRRSFWMPNRSGPANRCRSNPSRTRSWPIPGPGDAAAARAT